MSCSCQVCASGRCELGSLRVSKLHLYCAVPWQNFQQPPSQTCTVLVYMLTFTTLHSHFHAAGSPLDEELQNLSAECLARVLPHTSGYIWQGDPFRLLSSTQQASPWSRRAAAGQARRPAGSAAGKGHQGTPAAGQSQRPAARAAGEGEGQQPTPAEDLAPHLWGSINFGDNLEDEWFATWLLLELTRQVR